MASEKKSTESTTPSPASDALGAVQNHPNMATALVHAMTQAQAVQKDSHNRHHNYNYASAEAILAETRAVLARNGLAIIPTKMEIRNNDESKVPPSLVREFKLVFTDGHAETLTIEWPIIAERGRPFDKALAIADTASLKYLLRDLLLLERVDLADEMDARNDSSSSHSRGDSARESYRESYRDSSRESPRDSRPAPPPMVPVREVARIVELATAEELEKLEKAYPDGITPEIRERAIQRLIAKRTLESAEAEPVVPFTAPADESAEPPTIAPAKRSA